MGTDLAPDLFAVQYADYEDIPAEQYTGQSGRIGVSGWRKQYSDIDENRGSFVETDYSYIIPVLCGGTVEFLCR